MNPTIPERSDGLPLNLNDQLLLTNGIGITVREFLQVVGGGLKFGEIEISPTAVIENFRLTQNTTYIDGQLAPDPEGETRPPYDVKFINAVADIDQEFILDISIPEAGYVALTLGLRGVDTVDTLFGNEIIPNFFAIGFAQFGGVYHCFFSETFAGDGTSQTLPSGAISSPDLRLILENGFVRIEGIAPEVFSIPIPTNLQLEATIYSIGFITPVPQPVNFTLQAAGDFGKPSDWAPGNFYTVLSGGELYGYLFYRDDFLLVSGENTVIPFRFGDFITRLEIVGIISDTVDGYIVSAPVQALLQNMVETKIASMMQETGPGSLQEFVHENDYSRVWECLFPGENSNGTIYTLRSINPEMIYIPDRSTSITIFVRTNDQPDDVPSHHRIFIPDSMQPRSINFSCFPTKLLFGGDMVPPSYSISQAGYNLDTGEGMIAEVQLFPVNALTSDDPTDLLENIVFLNVTKVKNLFQV